MYFLAMLQQYHLFKILIISTSRLMPIIHFILTDVKLMVNTFHTINQYMLSQHQRWRFASFSSQSHILSSTILHPNASWHIHSFCGYAQIGYTDLGFPVPRSIFMSIPVTVSKNNERSFLRTTSHLISFQRLDSLHLFKRYPYPKSQTRM